MSRSSALILVFVALFVATIVFNARRHRTSERHTLAWLLVCAAIAGLAIWRSAVDTLADALGIYYPPSALFFLCCAALLFMVFRLSLEVTEQKRQMRKLAQEVALMSVESDPRQASASSSAGASPVPVRD